MICVVSWLDSSIILGLDSFTYSGILNVVEWCADQKPHISDKTAANNTLIVSSSENMNDTTCNDPASFDIVISSMRSMRRTKRHRCHIIAIN